MSTGCAAKIPPSRLRAAHFRIRRFRMSRGLPALGESLAKDGLHPFHLPLGILLDEKDGKATPTSICIRCDAFDGFPCLLNGKADAQVVCIDPALQAHPNLTLLTGAYASRLETDASGRAVTGVHVTRNGEEERYSADIVVVACGALSSALLLLRSGSDSHPNGLGQWLRPGRAQLHAA